jgi:hypothetical protein
MTFSESSLVLVESSVGMCLETPQEALGTVQGQGAGMVQGLVEMAQEALQAVLEALQEALTALVGLAVVLVVATGMVMAMALVMVMETAKKVVTALESRQPASTRGCSKTYSPTRS